MEKMTVSFPAENLGACGSHAVFARNAPSFRVGEGVPFLRRMLVASVILSRFPVPHNLALPGVIPPPTVASSRALRSSEVPPVRLPAHPCDPLGPAPSSPSPTAGGRRRREGHMVLSAVVCSLRPSLTGDFLRARPWGHEEASVRQLTVWKGHGRGAQDTLILTPKAEHPGGLDMTFLRRH